MPRPVWIPEDEAAEERLGLVGTISNKFSPYDGLTDEECEQLKKELDEKAARRIPAGFRSGKQNAKIGGRRAGSWPKVKWLS